MKHTAAIEKKKWFNENIFGLELSMRGIKPMPGQFFQLRISDNLDPFLNRPISVASYLHNRLLFIIKIVGRGTRMLSEKNVGDDLTLWGPLGKGIQVKKKKSLLIAGGIGVAPLYHLAQELHKRRIDFTFLYGTKKPADLVLKNSLSKMADRTIFVTEKGSKKKMTAVAALKKIDLKEYKIAYTCGPRKMLIELQRLNLPIPVYAFCEDFLGCGCGLCLGCAIMYRGEYKRICEDGPVFELGGIEFN